MESFLIVRALKAQYVYYLSALMSHYFVAWYFILIQKLLSSSTLHLGKEEKPNKTAAM